MSSCVILPIVVYYAMNFSVDNKEPWVIVNKNKIGKCMSNHLDLLS